MSYKSNVLDGQEVVNIIVSPNSNVAVVIACENDTLLNFYLAATDPENESDYTVTHELQMFQFFTKEQALEFAENVTSMSALDLIIQTGTQRYLDQEEVPAQ